MSGARDPIARRLRRMLTDDESGQAMVEFVLVFPMQLLLTLAIIQFAFIVYAHIVVGQAAFLGARAAAVADMMPIDPQQAATRVVARTVGVLTPNGTDGTAVPTKDVTHPLTWYSSGGRYGFPELRQQEAYGLLKRVGVRQDRANAYVSCDVEFDYVMHIPVANHFFAKLAANFGRSRGLGLTVFPVRRVGFIAVPWASAPSEG